jgi:predicted enzyme related to lactoylglutathione lyase
MPEVNSYRPGMFSWVDLSTMDVPAAKGFYEAIFGWDSEDMPPTDPVYTIFRMHGKQVAGTFKQPESLSGKPPMWLVYFTVASADETVASAMELGGSVVIPPRDVGDAGRMSMLQSPTGELFALWEAGARIGADLVNEHGCLVWNELWSTDVARSRDFYTELFGWTAASDGPNYTVFSVDGRGSNGLQAVPEEMAGHPSYWLTYFEVDDCDKVAQASAGEGAKILDGPRSMQGVGRFAVIQDPQRAAFAVVTTEGDHPAIDW